MLKREKNTQAETMVPSSMSTLQNWCKNVTTTTKIGKKLCTCESIKHISLVFTQHCSATRRFFLHWRCFVIIFQTNHTEKSQNSPNTDKKYICRKNDRKTKQRGRGREREKKKIVYCTQVNILCIISAFLCDNRTIFNLCKEFSYILNYTYSIETVHSATNSASCCFPLRLFFRWFYFVAWKKLHAFTQTCLFSFLIETNKPCWMMNIIYIRTNLFVKKSKFSTLGKRLYALTKKMLSNNKKRFVENNNKKAVHKQRHRKNW